MSKYNRDYLKMSDQHCLVYREMVVIPTSVAYGRYWLTYRLSFPSRNLACELMHLRVVYKKRTKRNPTFNFNG